MNNFWIGVIITLTGKIIISLYALIFLEELYISIRRFINWLPFGISLAFNSGYLIVFLTKATNESVNTILIVFITLLLGLMSVVLENNLFVLYSAWKKGNDKAIRNISYILYFICLIISFFPFFYYYSLTKIRMIPTISIGLFIYLIYCYSFVIIRNAAETSLRLKLKQILVSFNRHSFSVFSEEYDDEFYSKASVKELELRLEVVNKTLRHLQFFFPESSGNVLPGVKNDIVPVKRIKNISNELVASLLNETYLTRGKLHILIGNDAQALEGYDIVSYKSSKEVADSLNKRRHLLRRHL
ncbi:MAG: hypothetical protein JXB49_05095 [Bacteroidales bacterium]|nr:hypothetical protein [Bacteroidales bacterium]